MTEPAPWTRLRIVGPAVAALAIAAHASSLANGFVYDDHWTILANPVLRDVGNLPRLFGASFARDGIPDAARPAFLASALLDRAVSSGLGVAHAFVAHTHNLILHALVAVVVLILLQRLSFSVAVATFAAALFAVHPMNVEVVAVASYREDLLAALGVLVGIALLAGRESGRIGAGRAAAAASAIVFAGFAKESAYVAPILVATVELGRRGRRGTPVAIAAVAAGTSAAWRWLVLGRADVVSLGAEIPDVAWPSRLATGCAALLRGALRFFTLRGYAPEYATGWQSPPSPVVGALAILTVAVVLIVAWRGRGRWPGAAMGVTFAFAASLPTLGVVAITNAEADRYLYLASVGLCLVVADLLRHALRAGGRFTQGELLGVPVPLAAAAVVLALVAARTPGYTRVWHDDLALWTHGVERQPLASRAWANLASARLDVGDTLAALAAAERSLRLADVGGTRALIGGIRLRQGDVPGACAAFEAAIERTPARSERRADVLDGMGLCELGRGAPDAALVRFDEAAALSPRADAPVVHAVMALDRAGRRDDATSRLRDYLIRNPDSALAWALLSDRLAASGASDDASEAAARARSLGHERDDRARALTQPGRR